MVGACSEVWENQRGLGCARAEAVDGVQCGARHRVARDRLPQGDANGSSQVPQRGWLRLRAAPAVWQSLREAAQPSCGTWCLREPVDALSAGSVDGVVQLDRERFPA